MHWAPWCHSVTPAEMPMSHVSWERVTANRDRSCLVWMSYIAYKWVMSRMNESRCICRSLVSCDRVTSHMNVSCFVWMSHVPYELVTSRVNESRCIHRRRTSDLKYLRLPNYLTSCHGRPHTYQTRFHGSPHNFKCFFNWVNGVPVTQKIYRENR